MLNSYDVKDVKGFEGIYTVDTEGNVSNSKKVLKYYTNNSGYACLKLTKDGVKSSHLVHRLVAEAFLPNPEGKEEVNHKDGNKLNNAVDNLEWVSSEENKKHARDSGLWTYNKPTKGLKLGSSSKYRYVCYDKERKKWSSYLRVKGKAVGQKRFDTEVEAALHVNKLIKEHNSHVELNVITEMPNDYPERE